jgi:hypothetical protein
VALEALEELEPVLQVDQVAEYLLGCEFLQYMQQTI